MTQYIHYAPSQDEVYAFNMQVQHGESYTLYRIILGNTSEGQKERLSKRYGIALRILEDAPELVLKVLNEIG